MVIRAETGLSRTRFDWLLVGALGLLIGVGSVAILSAASPLPLYTQIIQRHFLALAMGIVLFLFGATFNYQIYQDQARTLYVLTLAMMLGVLLVGQVQRGQRAWIRLPYFSFQPSELARLLTVLVLANFLDRRAKQAQSVSTVLGAFAIVAPVMVLILKEPDFSSTLSFFPLLLGMLFCAGANGMQLLGMTAYGSIALGLPLLWTLLGLRPSWVSAHNVLAAVYRIREFDLPILIAFGAVFLAAFVVYKLFVQMRLPVHGPYFAMGALIVAGALASAVLVNHQLKGYQRNRFVAFLVPEADPKGAAYNVQQAQIAIGSGGLWGKGIFSGTQSQLGFLPERHTDFIYAVVGEETGFIGAMGVLALYLLLLSRVVGTAKLSRDRYGYLVCAGVASVYGFHLVVNVGMCLGLFPVAGIPLPLLSYGGSNLAVTLLTMGVVTNIYSRRYAFA